MSMFQKLAYAISSRNDSDMMMLLSYMTIDQVNNAETVLIPRPGYHFPYDLSVTALHIACFVNNTTAVAVILALEGSELNPKLKNENRGTSHQASWIVADSTSLNVIYNYPMRMTDYTPIMLAAALKHKESFELLVQDERVDLRATAFVNGKIVGLPDMFEDTNGENQKMLIKLLTAMRKQPSIKLTNIDMPKTTELEVLRDHKTNFGKFLESGALSDFRIICGDQTFHCHKNILFAQSNVLRTMFSNEMRETREDSMTITDLEPTIVQYLVKFIYTGSIDEKEAKENATKLLEVADRYELKGLTKLCENELISSIDNSNVIEMVTKADLYHAEKLREAAMRWIVDNKFEIVKQVGWKEILCRFPNLMADMLDALTTK